MAKRFIDTGLFDDEWFCNLSKEGKIFFMYFITKCDHAGILKLNKSLCEFQTGLKNLDTIIKELSNRISTVGEQLLYCSKFLEFQYPGFPNCKFNAALSAIRTLEANGIDYLTFKGTVEEELDNSPSISKGKGIYTVNPKKIFFKDSVIFDKSKFKEAFKDWNDDKLKYYYDSVLAWSNEGNKKIDWVATVRTWATRDEKEGKIKFEVKKKHSSII